MTTLAAAPLFDDIAEGPPGGRAIWCTAADGRRIRLAFWPAPGAKGTVLLIPGRTEYIEKYGPAAVHLGARGYATAVMDVRGQGLADRLVPDAMMGHVDRFADYQHDLRACLAALPELGRPLPLFLMAHSMGGAIGLRALIEGFPVRAAVFSAPMWGIHMSPAMAPVARVIGTAARAARLGIRYAPTTGPDTYVLAAPFEGNTLTHDPDMWAFMVRQARARPDLTLGGPSLHWLDAALTETRWLSRQPAPALPCLATLGTAEQIVDRARIRARMAAWPGGVLDLVEGAAHETMMETPAIRARFYDAAAALFDAHA